MSRMAGNAVVNGVRRRDFTWPLEFVNLEPEPEFVYGSTIEGNTLAAPALEPDKTTGFEYQHGRRYHSFVGEAYGIPNDETEISRLESQYRMWNIIFDNQLAMAPLANKMTHVLEIGAGTGAWGVQFARENPDVTVICTDLSPIQREDCPPNCSFLVKNANEEWPSEFHGRFDYIHTRAVSFGIQNWKHVISQAWKCLKPGGWLELQEFFLIASDDGTGDGTAIVEWGQVWVDAAGKTGCDVDGWKRRPEIMREVGFRNIGMLEPKIPLGPWPKGEREKQVGNMMFRNVHDNIIGVTIRSLVAAGHSIEEVEKLSEAAKADMKNPAIHTFMPLELTWGHKPLKSKL